MISLWADYRLLTPEQKKHLETEKQRLELIIGDAVAEFHKVGGWPEVNRRINEMKANCKHEKIRHSVSSTLRLDGSWRKHEYFICENCGYSKSRLF